MRVKSVGLLLVASAVLLPAAAGAAPTLTVANGQKAAFGLNDCTSNAKRTFTYEGSVGTKLKVFMAKGTCPDEVADGQAVYLDWTTLTSSNASGTVEVPAEDLDLAEDCPVDETIERHLCAVEKIKSYNYTTGASTDEVGGKADLTITYDSEPPGAPTLKEASGGEEQIHLTWDGGNGANKWMVCLKKVGDPVEQSTDPCAAFASQEQALSRTGCDDGIQNNLETDIDCGGNDCGKCAETKTCAAASDCLSNICTEDHCVASCTDEIKDGDETDADCGGSCPDDCADTKACGTNDDCQSGACTDSVCTNTCNDSKQNGKETGVDCGGVCLKCDGAACSVKDDCRSGVCTEQVCAAPGCEDGVMNSDETAIDCGGNCEAGCAAGQACKVNDDCASKVCTDGKCAPAVNENPFASGCDKIETFDGASTRKGTVPGLVNGQKYLLQMVAIDEAGNYSAVSGTKDSTPQPVFDFYERYRCAGGTEEGGFGCSSGGMALLPLAGLAALGLVRRRRGGRNA